MKENKYEQIQAFKSNAMTIIAGFARGFAGVALILICAVVALCVGRYYLSPSEIYTALLGDNEAGFNVIVEFRLPRVVLAIVVGSGLSLAGLAFQSLFRNPLATPDILGVTNGASFGAILALLFGLGVAYINLFGLLFGLMCLGLVVLVSYDRNAPYDTMSMVLSGIIISALFSSLISLVKYVADPQDTLPTITYWLLGSLELGLGLHFVAGVVGIICGSVVLYALRWKLNLLALSDDEAKALGVNLLLLRVVVILACTVIVACSVGMCGVIGWVGLLVPHIARLIVGNENAKIAPLCVIIGAIFLLLVDTVSRTISSEQIPISILTALSGAPFFIYILHKARRNR